MSFEINQSEVAFEALAIRADVKQSREAMLSQANGHLSDDERFALIDEQLDIEYRLALKATRQQVAQEDLFFTNPNTVEQRTRMQRALGWCASQIAHNIKSIGV
ncbi:MAG: hypothetical protein ACR2FM_00725 [Candidatus Saccharimonadales bacterium]